jgi:peptide/nickel transport system substrate-binding protein
MSFAIDRQGVIDAVFEGVGVLNPAVPTALKDWSLPIAQLGEGAKFFKRDVAEAKRLLAAAGYPNGFAASLCFNSYGSTQLTDIAQLIATYLKDIGIDTKLDRRSTARSSPPATSANLTPSPTGRRPRSSTPTTSSPRRTCRGSQRTRVT